MLDVIFDTGLEGVTAVILVTMTVLVWRVLNRCRQVAPTHARLILVGFALLSVGAMIDVADDLSSLLELEGLAILASFLEKGVGATLGFALLGIGLIGWFPAVIRALEAAHRRNDERRALLETMFNTLPNPIYHIDINGYFRGGNAAFAELFARAPDDLPGTHLTALSRTCAAAGRLAEAADRLRRDSRPLRFEVHIASSEVGARDMLVSTALYRDRFGGAGIVGVMLDVTEEKRLERELRAERDKAEMANRAKSEFLSVMNHELRTPLNSILGFSELIRDQVFGPIEAPRYSRYAALIHEAGSSLSRVIDDMMAITRIEIGRVALAPVEAVVTEVVGSCLSLFWERASRRGQVLVQAPIDDELIVWADTTALKQILFALLSNAIDLAPCGARILVSAQAADDGGCMMTIADDAGAGTFETADLAGVWPPAPPTPPAEVAPFAVAKTVDELARRSRRDPLSDDLRVQLAHGLVDLHNGRLSVEHRPDRGSVVRLSLPPRSRAPLGAVDPDSTAEPGHADRPQARAFDPAGVGAAGRERPSGATLYFDAGVGPAAVAVPRAVQRVA